MLISGIDLQNGKPLVVKLLPTNEAALGKAAAAEIYAVALLGLNSPTVPLAPIEVCGTPLFFCLYLKKFYPAG